MSSASPSLFKRLVNEPVVVKIPGWSRALPGTVVAIDDNGFWFAGNEIMVALKEANGSAMTRITQPALYVPFSGIEWLVASEPQGTAETESIRPDQESSWPDGGS